jgi:hypothetical protein
VEAIREKKERQGETQEEETVKMVS